MISDQELLGKSFYHSVLPDLQPWVLRLPGPESRSLRQPLRRPRVQEGCPRPPHVMRQSDLFILWRLGNSREETQAFLGPALLLLISKEWHASYSDGEVAALQASGRGRHTVGEAARTRGGTATNMATATKCPHCRRVSSAGPGVLDKEALVVKLRSGKQREQRGKTGWGGPGRGQLGHSCWVTVCLLSLALRSNLLQMLRLETESQE